MPSLLDDAFRAMADPTRRRILVALAEQNPQNAATLHPVDLSLTDAETRKLTTEMYHSHLPWLEEAGLVTWDRDTHELEKGPNFDEIRPILTLLEGDPDTLATRV